MKMEKLTLRIFAENETATRVYEYEGLNEIIDMIEEIGAPV